MQCWKCWHLRLHGGLSTGWLCACRCCSLTLQAVLGPPFSLLPLSFPTEELWLLSSGLPPPPKSSLVVLSPHWSTVAKSAAPNPVPIPEPRNRVQLCYIIGEPSLLLKEEVTFERAEEGLNPGLEFWGSQGTVQNRTVLVRETASLGQNTGNR